MLDLTTIYSSLLLEINLLSFYFCFDKIFCSTLNSLTPGYTATSPCLHFHFDADQVLKMNCSLVILVTPQKRGSKLKKFQKFKMYFAVGRLKCKQGNVKKLTSEIGIIFIHLIFLNFLLLLRSVYGWMLNVQPNILYIQMHF